MPIVSDVVRRVQAAQGKIPCDLILKGGRVLDVFGAEWIHADIAVIDGVIVGLGDLSGLKATRVISIQGRHVVPGFIDAHVHVESSLMIPEHFQRSVLPKGTTTAVCDPHELANVLGANGIRYFLESATQMALDLRVMLSSCVPATHFETNGGGAIEAAVLTELGHHPRALGLAEMMNVPGVLNADPGIMAKLKAFEDRPIDGHCPKLTGLALSAYAAAGITSCHESSEYAEGLEKLRKGIAVWIREGSVAKDLDALVPLLTLGSSAAIGFCTDDRNPLDIAQEGHLDYLLRRALATGVDPRAVYRAASWTVARHYGLDRGPNRVGAIAPGYRADLVVLGDMQTCGVEQVYKSGLDVRTLDFAVKDTLGLKARNTIDAVIPEAEAFVGPKGKVHVIGVIPGKILTDHLVMKSDAPGVARMSVLERYGRKTPPANGYVFGFGENFRGAIASSVGHDSHNLAVIGSSTEDMRAAVQSLKDSGGGFSVVKDGKRLAHLPLPFGGLMTDWEPARVTKALTELRAASVAVGCELHEPFLQLAFLCLPVIPSLKLTDQGLIDVEKFEKISVQVA